MRCLPSRCGLTNLTSRSLLSKRKSPVLVRFRVRADNAERINTFIALQFLFDHFWKQLKVGGRLWQNVGQRGCATSWCLLHRHQWGVDPALRMAVHTGAPSLALSRPPHPLLPLLQAYANARGVGLVGDMPIYVGGQSADVWAHRHLFELQPDGKPALVRCASAAWVLGLSGMWAAACLSCSPTASPRSSGAEKLPGCWICSVRSFAWTIVRLLVWAAGGRQARAGSGAGGWLPSNLSTKLKPAHPCCMACSKYQLPLPQCFNPAPFVTLPPPSSQRRAARCL